MAFISCTCDRYDSATNQYIYTLVDSDFGAVEVGGSVGREVWVVREYSKRDLPVGRNLALLVLYLHKQYADSVANIKRWQDKYCHKYIENWDMYAKERDHHLSKLSSLL